MVANAHLYVEPTVLIGTVEVQCHFQQVTLLAEVFRTADIETYCNPGGEAPSGVRWIGNFRVRMSYGTDSAWDFFSALDPTVPTEDITIYPADPGTGTATADNPSATFDAYIDPIGFIPDHEVGGSGTFDLAFRVVGEPIFDDTP
jgi:hypothetical protein